MKKGENFFILRCLIIHISYNHIFIIYVIYIKYNISLIHTNTHTYKHTKFRDPLPTKIKTLDDFQIFDYKLQQWLKSKQMGKH